MNKKFLSAVLFGALMVTSTGTFVSCKDYDDDIDAINKELTDIKSAIDALQAKVDGGKYVTNIVKEGDGIKITWNDNSTSVIETIKGENGEDGKNGTVVTIIDGFWAFDGVKSEYPAKGDKGDKGDQGEAGKPGDAAAAGHDAQISEDGYWMVWDAEAGEYKKTEYIAGGATAVAGDHGWTIIVRDQNGKEQSIYIPNSADLVSIQDAMAADDLDDIDIYYGLLNAAVDWDGAKAVNGKMEAGMYPVLSQDVMIMLNPTGVDGTAYKFAFKDSDNEEPWGLKFGDVQPYAGSKLTRAASASGVWVLPRAIDRVPLTELNERADYVTQFKSNDGDEYAFALNATSKEDASKVIKSQYIYSFDPTNIGSMKADGFSVGLDKYNYIWNVWHKPNFNAFKYSLGTATSPIYNVYLSDVVYDYKLEIDKTKMTQVAIDKYGLEISEDGYTFKASKEAAVDNHMHFKVSYILVNGSKHTKDFEVVIRNKDIVVVDNNIGSINEAFNATVMTNSKIAALNGQFVYGAKELSVDLATALGANYDEWIDAMYQGLMGQTNTVKANFLKKGATVVGGDPINNDAEYNRFLIDELVYFDYVDANGKSCIYDVANNKILEKLGEIKALKVYFIAGTYNYYTSAISQTAVTAPYYTVRGTDVWRDGFAIPLNNAFRVQVAAAKEELTVGTFNFTFQLTQPEIDKVGILPKDGLFTQWAHNDSGSTLYSFGAYDATVMKLPLYEAFDMWTADGANLYRWQNANAQWYMLRNSNPIADGVQLLGASTPTTQPQTNNQYQIDWNNYNTVASAAGGLMTRALAATPQADATINVDVKYNFFGVYPALAEQLPFYLDANDDKQPGFKLVFASTIKKATLKTKEDIYYAKAGTNYVFISNDDVVAQTMLGKDFVLFDGIDANGRVAVRETLNDARGFNEEIRPFDTQDLYTFSAASVSTSGAAPMPLNIYLRPLLPAIWNVNVAAGTIEPAVDVPYTGSEIAVYNVPSSQAYPVGDPTYPNGLPAVESGFVIQLGEAIDYRQPVEVTITVKDNLGFKNTLKVKVQKLQN